MEVFNNGDLTIAGVLTENSDVNSKTNILEIDPMKVLSAVVALPISRWEYKDAPGESHIGPMAQDFHTAFGLGKSNTGISTLDTSGVALASIQALEQRNQELEGRIRLLESIIADVLPAVAPDYAASR
jgi:hypothetical protein